MAEHTDIIIVIFIFTTVSVPTTEIRVTMNDSQAYLRFRTTVSPALPYPSLCLSHSSRPPPGRLLLVRWRNSPRPGTSCSSPIARCSGSRMIMYYRANQQPCSSDADDNLPVQHAQRRTGRSGMQRNETECESPQGLRRDAVNRHHQGKNIFGTLFIFLYILVLKNYNLS